MKWIKNREKFLNEAKIRDVIFPSQAKKIAEKWGEKYLDYEEVEATDKIKQGKWKLDSEDKDKVLNAFFQCDMNTVYNVFKSVPEKLSWLASQSIDTNLLSEGDSTILSDFNLGSPTIDQMVIIFNNIFRKLNINETRATEKIQKDENGRPVKDEDGNVIKVKKEAGEPVFTNNLVNINAFIQDYNRCYEESKVSENLFQNGALSNLRSFASDYVNDYKSDFEIFNRDMYLSISHNPKDILNMSISRFYSSCQHLYTGGYNDRVLGNVFDPNSIPAFLIFETPLFWGRERISEFLPLSRMIIRNIESFDEVDNSKPVLYFDRAYYDRMKNVFDEIVEKYSGNKKTDKYVNNYLWTPDIDHDDNLTEPYMDQLGMRRGKYIGVNTKRLYLNANYDWSKIRISPKAKIEELVVETTELPENLLDIKLDIDWIKFKYIKINTLSGFENIKTDSIAFDKCKLNNNVIDDIAKFNLKKLQLVSCNVSNLKFDQFKGLDELQLIYTIDSIDELKSALEGISLKKLVISGDLVTKENKQYINSLKNKMKVEIVGPVI